MHRYHVTSHADYFTSPNIICHYYIDDQNAELPRGSFNTDQTAMELRGVDERLWSMRAEALPRVSIEFPENAHLLWPGSNCDKS